jgi:hypothetical protein
MTPAAASGPDLLIVLVVLLFAVVGPLWAVVDAASRPAPACYDAGSNKTIWVVVIAVAWFIGLGFFLGGVLSALHAAKSAPPDGRPALRPRS